MRGRKPSGPEFVDKLRGSAKAKERVTVVLKTMTGMSVHDACTQLGIGEARFDQIRSECLQAAVDALEDKPAGRPARTPSPAEVENQRLRADNAQLQADLQAAMVRVELAVGLPRVGAASKKNDSAAPAPALSDLPAEPMLRPSLPNEEAVVNHLKDLIPTEPVAEGPPRRGFAGQRRAREQEQATRRRVVDVAARLSTQGWSQTQAAGLLGLPARTLRDWQLDNASHQLRAIPLGRPVTIAPTETRLLVVRRIDELGPGIGVPSLHVAFPTLPRAEVTDILTCFRRSWRWEHRQQLQQLHWSKPGSVWAIDLHGPRTPLVDGRIPFLLAARDLASGQVLLWLPVTDATAHTVIEAIEVLFLVHGAPLVLKSDNGSAFIAAPLRKLCRRFGVKNLYSPPRTPSYNGSIEATIGSLKIRTERHAAQDGRPGHWTKADTEFARHDANTTARPHGAHGPSPDQVWTARTPIAQAQRDQFFAVATRRFENLASHGAPKDDAQHRAMDRVAISQVLVELGYLSITRGRIRLPVCKKKVAELR